MSKQAKVATSAGLLRDVHRRVDYMHRVASRQQAIQIVSDYLQLYWADEKKLREYTISIKFGNHVDHSHIMATIVEKWCEQLGREGVMFWRDYYHTYCEFTSAQMKNEFLDCVKTNASFESIKSLIEQPLSNGLHFQRRPIKFMIPGINPRIEPTKIGMALTRSAPADSVFSEIKAGKLFGARQVRTISFSANASGFNFIFNILRGRITYTDVTTAICTKLNVKINIKPFMCNKCYIIGRHDCKGRACSFCSAHGHSAAECHSTVEFCINCKKPTHKSNNRACPTYLNLLVKEIRKFDIPIEFMEDAEARFRLINCLTID